MEVRVSIQLSVKCMVYPEPGSLEFTCFPLSVFKQTKRPVYVLLVVDRLDFQIRGRMKAPFHSVWAPVALSPSCPCFFHAPSVLFTNLCFYSELVILCFLLLTEDCALCFNSFRIQCHFLKNTSNKMCFSYRLCLFFFNCGLTVYAGEYGLCLYYQFCV